MAIKTEQERRELEIEADRKFNDLEFENWTEWQNLREEAYRHIEALWEIRSRGGDVKAAADAAEAGMRPELAAAVRAWRAEAEMMADAVDAFG